VIKIDASKTKIRVVLVQEKKTIAFFSQKLGPKNQTLSVYENELFALLAVVKKWKHYLLGSPFIIRTDQINLKYLLEQRVNTIRQHKGLSKLLGLDHTIEYKKGSDNMVADALSKKDIQEDQQQEEQAELKAVIEIIPQWMEELQLSYKDDDWIEELKKKAVDNSSDITIHQGLVRYRGKVCIGKT
jgi:RNase H-like domain found in reverse transcriptase